MRGGFTTEQVRLLIYGSHDVRYIGHKKGTVRMTEAIKADHLDVARIPMNSSSVRRKPSCDG
jgi:hypothetical protein